jgi:hypothetical protein
MAGLLEKDQVGKREDLADIIAVAEVADFPFTSMLRKGKELGNTLLSWQADAYATPNTSGKIDGKDVTDFENPAENRGLLRTYTQMWERTAKVSTLSQKSDVAGIGKGKEMAHGVAKKLVEIKKDIEATFLGGNECQADDGTVPYLTRGLDVWIQSTAQSLYPVPEAFRPTSAQIDTTACASLTETNVQTVLKAAFANKCGVQDLVLFCGVDLRRAFTDFTRTNTAGSGTAVKVRSFNVDIDAKTISATTAVFEGDFGTVKLIPDIYVGGATADVDRGYGVPMKMAEMRWTFMPEVKPLEDQGGGPRSIIQCAGALVVLNPQGCFKFKP